MSRATYEAPASAADRDGRPLDVPRRQRWREGSGVGAVTQGVGLLARLVSLAVSIVVAIIVAGILLVVLKANPANSIVSEVESWARWLAGPFDGMFSLHSANATIAVNWGIAAVVYLLVGALIVRLLGGTYPYPRRYSSNPNREVL
jgi:hypothetical protein